MSFTVVAQMLRVAKQNIQHERGVVLQLGLL